MLVRLAQNNPQIRKLDLKNYDKFTISLEGIYAMLSKLKRLKKLACDRIVWKGLKRMMSIDSINSLEELHVSHLSISSKKMTNIARSLKHLSHIILENARLFDLVVEGTLLVNLTHFEASKCVLLNFAVFKNCQKLKSLDLSDSVVNVQSTQSIHFWKDENFMFAEGTDYVEEVNLTRFVERKHFLGVDMPNRIPTIFKQLKFLHFLRKINLSDCRLYTL